jgi:hypothetical protein
MSETEAASAAVSASASKGRALPALSPELERKLMGEHGVIAVMPTPLGVFVFRTPAQEDYERFANRVSADKSNKIAAARELANLSLVHPDIGALTTLFEKYPASALPIANKLQELAGQDFEIEVKKG